MSMVSPRLIPWGRRASIFQIPAGQRVEDTPTDERTFIFPEHGGLLIQGILSIDPQVRRATRTQGRRTASIDKRLSYR